MPKQGNVYKDFVVFIEDETKVSKLTKKYNPRRVWEGCLDETDALSRFVSHHGLNETAHEFTFQTIEVKEGSPFYEEFLRLF